MSMLLTWDNAVWGSARLNRAGRAGRPGRARARCAGVAALAAFAFASLAAAGPGQAQAAGPAAICPAGERAQTIWLEDFEGAKLGWTAQALRPLETAGAPSGGQLAGTHWHFPPPVPGALPWRGAGNLWADILPGGKAATAESAIEMADDVALPAGAQLLFVHRFDFSALERSYGAVELSTDGGLTWKPWGAFKESVDGYRSSHVDLAALAGAKLRLRFRLATFADGDAAVDPSGGAFRGWAIDDVHIYRCLAGGGPAAPTPAPVEPVANPGARTALTLGLTVSGRSRALRPGARARLRVLVENGSRRPLRRLKVCFRAPRRLLIGTRCVTIRRLPGLAAAEIPFPVKVSRALARRGRVKVRFSVKLDGVEIARAARRYWAASPPRPR